MEESFFEEKTEKQLIQEALENPEAFGQIIQMYHKRLFFFVKRMSFFSAEDIEDILQNAYIKIYKNLNRYDDDMKFSTWIYQVVRNTVIDEIRKVSSRPKTQGLEDEEVEKIFRSDIDIEREIHGKDDLNRLEKIIEELPEKYREVVILRFLEEKSYEEIMDIVKLPKGTVAARINRAKKMLKEKFDV